MRINNNFIHYVVLILPLFFFTEKNFAESLVAQELQIKIAYLYHFTKFVHWPTNNNKFHYCVYEDANFTQLLSKAYEEKTVNNQNIEVSTINTSSPVENCQLIYFPKSAPKELLTKINSLPILSVGSEPGFNQSGGIINLFNAGQNIRFTINNTAATNASLKISSHLLSLSKEP